MCRLVCVLRSPSALDSWRAVWGQQPRLLLRLSSSSHSPGGRASPRNWAPPSEWWSWTVIHLSCVLLLGRPQPYVCVLISEFHPHSCCGKSLARSGQRGACVLSGRRVAGLCGQPRPDRLAPTELAMTSKSLGSCGWYSRAGKSLHLSCLGDAAHKHSRTTKFPNFATNPRANRSSHSMANLSHLHSAPGDPTWFKQNGAGSGVPGTQRQLPWCAATCRAPAGGRGCPVQPGAEAPPVGPVCQPHPPPPGVRGGGGGYNSSSSSRRGGQQQRQQQRRQQQAGSQGQGLG